jgi:hypothetical protein
MRIWIVVGVSLLVGVIGGWAWTAAELGFWPRGNHEVKWGNTSPSLTPPAPASSGLAPKLVVEHDEFDFGSLEVGGTGRHTFVFKNQGRGPLVLTKGETSCVCTLASIENSEVPPGGSTKIEVQWHPPTHGPFRQSAQVLTNDPQRPRVELSIYGNVVASFRLVPERIVFSGLTANRGATGQARVYSYVTDHLTITEPEWSDKSTVQFYDLQIKPLSASQLKEEEGAKSGCLIQVTVKPGLPAGTFGETIRFHVNKPGNPALQLTVEGTVAGPIEIAGREWDAEHGMLMLGQVHSLEGSKSVLYLMIRGDALKQADIRLNNVVPKTLKVSVGKMEKMGPEVGRVPLMIEIPPGSRPEDHLGTQLGPLARIFLDTGLPDDKQMRILVRYAVEQ